MVLLDCARHFHGGQSYSQSRRRSQTKVVLATTVLAAGLRKAPLAVVAEQLGRRMSRHGIHSTHNQNIAVSIAAVPLATAMMWRLRAWRQRAAFAHRLRECQVRFNTVMRLWSLVMTVVRKSHNEKARRVASFHSLVLPPSLADDDASNQPTSRTLVETIPIPCSHCFWCVFRTNLK